MRLQNILIAKCPRGVSMLVVCSLFPMIHLVDTVYTQVRPIRYIDVEFFGL